ncbi:ATPase family AAA domain-containing protein 2-like isoform X3 [Physella acuta]|uniref:ATPase family AAA domain-containing protein 2-like isoform X3 n=1 Tax=Physella acuta TaxID=109671 RepID=UPI0027DDB664|nr:ATPase family AAA domain-containing protein 2-like isoform X3 [Physella acuta]
MVKTRHSGDIDVESPTTFLSLTTEKNRLSSRSGDTGENTHSRAYDEDRNAFNIFEEKVVESRLRPRTGPRAYNYLDADSSDEDSIRRRRHHIPVQDYSSERRTNYTRSRQVKQEMINAHDDNISKRTSRRRISYQDEDHSEEEEDEDNNSSGITHWDQSAESRARNSGRLRQRLSAGKATDQPTNVGQQYSEDDDDANVNENKCKRKYIKQQVSDDEEDDVNENKRKRKYTKQQVSYDEEDDAHVNETKRKRKYTKRQQVLDDEEAENLRRRSSRTRRQVYDTLNQSYLVSIPGRSKLESDEANDNSDNKEDSEDNQEFSDMYSRVKRKRVQVKRNMYGVPINDDSDSDPDIVKRNKSNNKDDDTDENCEEEEDTEKDDGNNNSNSRPQRDAMKKKKQPLIVKSYSLREHKPRTDLYKAPIKEPRIKRIHNSIFASTPTKKSANQTYHSPAQRRNIRKRSAFHSSSSSTSSSESESSDEKSFKRRKAKSMAKARSRMMPMNFSTNAQPSSSVIKDRVKSGASLADVEPMTIDRNVTFNSIGGLGKHIRALKEMVVFPLLYDKVFERFNVDPPRGVLFYGPPGTGKTLVARALANECSQGDRRVAFFMRKGADCLSKWVGESERQLRLLFDQAYKYRPSIIFFDEIDGLAPVRSSRQDQIHSSIVSTLLALMDGLDSRGEIVVIGATNRIDSLDPALRRPGRFDREFLFPLPTLEARKQILTIHTSSWRPKLNEFFISELAERCVGYCGADIKALCTEAAMLALRRRYPQIYMTNEALELDVSSINISAKDFFDAINNIIPTSQRSVNTPARALSSRVAPLLQHQLNQVLNQLADCFPPCLSQLSSLDAAATVDQAQVLTESGLLLEDLASDEDEEAPSIFTTSHKIHTSNFEAGPSTSAVPHYLNFTSYATSRPATFRPRLMLVGREGQGQTTYIAPAVLHRLESLPVHVLDLPTLYAVTAKTPEESCANVFHEAKRKCPSIIYIPYVDQWWGVMAETLRATLLTLIQDLNPSLPLLLLATSEQPYYTLDTVLQSLFCEASGEVVEMRDANLEERRAFFQDLLLKQTARPPPKKKQAGDFLRLLNEEKKANIVRKISKPKRKRKKMEGPHPGSMYPFHEGTRLSKERMKGSFPKVSKKESNNGLVDVSEVKCAASRHVRPLHRMVLRSRRAHQGRLNRNQSARGSVPAFKRPCIFLSNKPAPHHPYSLVPLKPGFEHSVLEARDGSISARRLRYLRRLQKLDAALYQSKCAGVPQCSHSCKLSSSDKSLRRRSLMSVGSSQMLYKKGGVEHQHTTVLPLNLRDLHQRTPHSQISCYNLRPRKRAHTAQRMLEVLPKAAPPKARELTKEEVNLLMEKEELTLMELRIFLRDVLNKLGSDKKFSIFAKPVNIDDAPDYYEIIEHPMDLSTMMGKIDLHEYGTVRSFMNDIDLICSNALEYNPNRGPMDRVIRHRACALKDTAYAIIKTELDKDFEKTCVEIEESRKRRGQKSTTVPNFYYTKPNSQLPKSQAVIPDYLEHPKQSRSIPKPEGERYSRRVRGLNIDPVPPLEAVEKVFKLSRATSSPPREDNGNDCDGGSQGRSDERTHAVTSPVDQPSDRTKANAVSSPADKDGSIPKKSPHLTSANKSKKNKCVWCKPRRKRRKLTILKAQSRQASGEEDNEEEMSCEEIDEECKPNSPKQTDIELLKIDTALQETDIKDLKSPGRCSSRLKHAPISPRVVTRRSSMSPTAEASHTLSKQLVQTSGEQTTLAKSIEETAAGSTGSAAPMKATEGPEKCSVVKRLDLDVVTDSGIGSSLDSNGDSRDSIEHPKVEGENCKMSTSVTVADANQNCNSSRASNQVEKKVEIDLCRLTSLLNELVAKTDGYNVERLEKLYSSLSLIIYRHRGSYDRSLMIVDLEQKVEQLTTV